MKFTDKQHLAIFKYIECSLVLYDEIATKELRQRFGISSVMASKILSGYRAKNPLLISRNGKYYKAPYQFKPMYIIKDHALSIITDIDCLYAPLPPVIN